MDKPNVEIYTDGACANNPGKGGYGAILMYQKKDGKMVFKKISKGFELTTNNRMELMAVVDALSILKVPCCIKLYSDSKYVIDAINKNWLQGWIKKNWKTSSNSKVKNVDLWQKFIQLSKDHTIEYIWVKGHNDNKYNELCDKMATEARSNNNLEYDKGFEL